MVTYGALTILLVSVAALTSWRAWVLLDAYRNGPVEDEKPALRERVASARAWGQGP